MMTFKNFMENLWGNIPSTERKPSDGCPNASQLSMSSNSKGGGTAPMGGSRMMMSKDDLKKKKNKKNDSED